MSKQDDKTTDDPKITKNIAQVNESNPPQEEEQENKQEIREQDRYLPITNIMRIMKKNLPKGVKISKGAKECVQECVSEFISFITSEASDKCKKEERRTITGDDILAAMSTLGFENYMEPLKLYLHKFREHKMKQQLDKGNDKNNNQNNSPNGGNTGNQTNYNIYYHQFYDNNNLNLYK